MYCACDIMRNKANRHPNIKTVRQIDREMHLGWPKLLERTKKPTTPLWSGQTDGQTHRFVKSVTRNHGFKVKKEKKCQSHEIQIFRQQSGQHVECPPNLHSERTISGCIQESPRRTLEALQIH